MKNNKNMESFSKRTDSLTEYLTKKANNHNCYKVYSTLDRVVEIRDNRCIYLGTGNKWNDIADRDSFNSDRYNVVNFGKCFSFSQDENVAMWMLYGGIEKKSGMIDFTKKGMQNILKTQHIEVGYFECNKYISCIRLPRESFKIYLIDVVYYKKLAKGYYIKRSEESVKNLSSEVFDGLVGCKKSYPWQYENECRLIISIDKAIIPSKCNVVKIDLNGIDMGKSFERIYHGPNYPNKDNKNTLPSNLDNSIDWALCDGHCLNNREEKK